MHGSDWDSKERDASDIIDGLAIGHEFKSLVHHQRALHSIPQPKSPPRIVAAYSAGGIAERAGVVKGSDLLDFPEPGLGFFPLESHGLLKGERTIALTLAKAVNLEGAGRAEKEPEGTLAVTWT